MGTLLGRSASLLILNRCILERDAERRETGYHAERGNQETDSAPPLQYRVIVRTEAIRAIMERGPGVRWFFRPTAA